MRDGLVELADSLSIEQVAVLIERTARWVSPDVFDQLPVWFPEHARGALFYKSDWSEPQMNTNRGTGEAVHKREGNTYANRALTAALGLKKEERPHWTCCHIWGSDDSTFQSANEIAKDSRFYSCVANMLLLPTPLKAFTDAMVEVKTMLRLCAKNLYGWTCEHELAKDGVQMVEGFRDWDRYPKSWPKDAHEKQPLGVMELNDRALRAIQRRKKTISRDLVDAGQHYPRQQVRKTLQFWNVNLGDQS